MSQQIVGGLLIAASAGALLACSSQETGRDTTGSAPSASSDSSRAVNAALMAIADADTASAWRVATYFREPGGTLLRLIWEGETLDGNVLVWVDNGGEVTIIRAY
jgi:uncharacterized lipoprotein YajG